MRKEYKNKLKADSAQLAMLAMATLKWEIVPQSQSGQFSNVQVFILINSVIMLYKLFIKNKNISKSFEIYFYLEPYSFFSRNKLILLPLRS